jgi:hypothetical protein
MYTMQADSLRWGTFVLEGSPLVELRIALIYVEPDLAGQVLEVARHERADVAPGELAFATAQLRQSERLHVEPFIMLHDTLQDALDPFHTAHGMRNELIEELPLI